MMLESNSSTEGDYLRSDKVYSESADLVLFISDNTKKSHVNLFYEISLKKNLTSIS